MTSTVSQNILQLFIYITLITQANRKPIVILNIEINLEMIV